jgi:hypothetical protein
VPLRGSDAFLFVSLALLAAICLFGKLSAVWVLVAGMEGPAACMHACCMGYGCHCEPGTGLECVLCFAAGAALGTLNYYVNLLQISNSISLWLGISPPDIFFYAVSGEDMWITWI